MLMEFLKSIRSGRKGVKSKRIGTLTSYLKRLSETVGAATLAKGLEIKESDLTAAIKNSSGKLVWFDPDNASPAGFLKAGDGGIVTTSGTLIGKADESKALEAGSVMDFDCTITTARRDRDGDVLDPKGAILDPKMPLLWQHMPFQPIGRMVRALEQNEERVAGRFMIANTALGNDAAVLVEAGCLRISHGFSPIEYNPLKDDQGKDMGGWRISKYAMMETSLVSIPSNVDAEIQQFSRGKLHHPLVKAWCKMLQKSQPKMVTSGFDGETLKAGGLNLTINFKGLGGVGGKPVVKDELPPDDDDEDGDEKEDEPSELEEEEKDESETEEGDDADEEVEEDAEEGKQAARALGELIDAARAMAKDQSLPKEAQRRMGVVDGLLEDIETSIAGSADALAAAAKGRDLVGIFTAVSEMTTGCVSKLRGVCEELGRIASLADMPEGAVKEIGGLSAEADDIVNAVGMLATASAEIGDDGEGDELEDDPEEAAESLDGEEDEEDDDEMKDESAETDDEDEVEKDGADEDESAIDPDEENPEVDDEENPGVPKGGSGSLSRAVDRLLGQHLTGKRLSPSDRDTLQMILGAPKSEQLSGRKPGCSRRRSAN
jgi:HK97 family phage prohead protease